MIFCSQKSKSPWLVVRGAPIDTLGEVGVRCTHRSVPQGVGRLLLDLLRARLSACLGAGLSARLGARLRGSLRGKEGPHCKRCLQNLVEATTTLAPADGKTATFLE